MMMSASPERNTRRSLGRDESQREPRGRTSAPLNDSQKSKLAGSGLRFSSAVRASLTRAPFERVRDGWAASWADGPAATQTDGLVALEQVSRPSIGEVEGQFDK